MSASPERREAPKRPWSKRVPEGHGPADGVWDAIVIGSGIGGMTTAGLLAKAGQRVLVLEAHYVPGGFTHAFRRKGFTWDVGVHLVGETSTRSLPGRVLHHLTEGKLAWQSVGDVYDSFHFPDGFSIDFPSDPAAFRDALVAAFPDSAEAVDAYLSEVRDTVKSMRGWLASQAVPDPTGTPWGAWFSRQVGSLVGRSAQGRLQQTASEVLQRLVPDERLRAVITAQWGYHGSTPDHASWALQALVVRHFQWGAAYPVGGAAAIAPAILQPVADAGGWTRIVAPVAQIRVEGGRAVGVRLEDGEELRAKKVVSAAGAGVTVARLLPPDLAAPWVSEVRALPASPAHLSLYLGFHGDIAAAGARRAAEWFYDTWDHEVGTWDVHPDRPVGRPPVLFTSYPSLKDPAHDPGPQQRHTGELITFVPWEAFARWQGTDWRKRGADYEAFKAEMSARMLEVLFEHHPGLEPLLVHHELSTPLSTDWFARPLRGAIYGLAGTPERFGTRWLRPVTPLPGLFLSGSDVATCGVMGALIGGVLAAQSIAPVAVGRQLRGLVT
jgi:all-trans-retinol 13,14-reductase